MYRFIFTKYSEKQLLKLDKQIQKRILDKLKYFKDIKDINEYIKNLYNLNPATHRFRIGNYRLLIGFDNKNIIIYKIAHRKEIYK